MELKLKTLNSQALTLSGAEITTIFDGGTRRGRLAQTPKYLKWLNLLPLNIFVILEDFYSTLHFDNLREIYVFPYCI